MSTKFAVMPDDTIRLVENPPAIMEVLPTDTYALKIDGRTGELYLESIEDFTMPEKLFGTVGQTAERVVNTYTDRTGVTGMLLTGEKGSGKTLLGKKVALDLKATYDMPIIVVNVPISGDQFGIFLQKLAKPVTLFFDEFEKVYGREEFQNGLLTILDGVYPVKMMAILTANDSSKMIAPLIDRPGRVFYKIDYAGLEYAFIMEYAQEKLKNQEHLNELSRLATMTELNFDQLQALIEEMNRYDESVSQAVQLLNISIGTNDQSMKVIRMVDEGQVIGNDQWNASYFYGNLNNWNDDDSDDEHEIMFGYLTGLPEPKTIHQFMRDMQLEDWDENDDWRSIRETFQSKIGYKQGSDQMPGMPHLMKFGKNTMIDVNRQGQITLTNQKGQVVVLEKTKASSFKQF